MRAPCPMDADKTELMEVIEKYRYEDGLVTIKKAVSEYGKLKYDTGRNVGRQLGLQEYSRDE